MNGCSELEAFKITGLDVAIQYFEQSGQTWVPGAAQQASQNPEWKEDIKTIKDDPDDTILHHTITTPSGQLTYKTGGNRMTSWVTEPIVKHHEDIDLIEKYMPIPKLDKDNIEKVYDQIGDDGILRGPIWGDQSACWQHACCLMNMQDMILETIDNPDWVHRFLKILLEKKLRFIEESLAGAKFDIIVNGGGASSDTVISPSLHREFCLPYDKQLHDAAHRHGFITTYHTCGGMMNILDLLIENSTDVSETLSPPGVGGNITEPELVREKFFGKTAMSGGMDQFNILGIGTKQMIEDEVQRLFEGFGKNGGYVMSACDHFFEAPVENLKIFAQAAKKCTY